MTRRELWEMIGGGEGGGGGAIALMHPSVSKLNEIGFYFRHLVLLFVIGYISLALRACLVYTLNLVQNITSVYPIKIDAREEFKEDFFFIQLKELALVIHWLNYLRLQLIKQNASKVR